MQRLQRVVVEKSPDVDALRACRRRHAADFGGISRRRLAIGCAERGDMRSCRTRAPRASATPTSAAISRASSPPLAHDCLISNAIGELRAVPHRVVMHEVNQVLALAQRAGATEIVPDLRVVIDESDRAAATDFPPNRSSCTWDGADRTRQHTASLLGCFANCARSPAVVATMGGCRGTGDRCARRGWPTGSPAA